MQKCSGTVDQTFPTHSSVVCGYMGLLGFQIYKLLSDIISGSALSNKTLGLLETTLHSLLSEVPASSHSFSLSSLRASFKQKAIRDLHKTLADSPLQRKPMQLLVALLEVCFLTADSLN
jgi:hypothetical protein